MAIISFLQRLPLLRRSSRPRIESIVAVALECQGLIIHLPAPARHADVLKAAAAAFAGMAGHITEGFLTSQGRFVDRVEASRVAVKARQIDHASGILVSTMLW